MRNIGKHIELVKREIFTSLSIRESIFFFDLRVNKVLQQQCQSVLTKCKKMLNVVLIAKGYCPIAYLVEQNVQLTIQAMAVLHHHFYCSWSASRKNGVMYVFTQLSHQKIDTNDFLVSRLPLVISHYCNWNSWLTMSTSKEKICVEPKNSFNIGWGEINTLGNGSSKTSRHYPFKGAIAKTRRILKRHIQHNIEWKQSVFIHFEESWDQINKFLMTEPKT